MTTWSFLTDFAIAGGLLLAGKLLRVYLPILQRLYLPAAVLAGLLGLTLGPYGVDVLPWSEAYGGNASMLTAMLFSALGLATPLPSPQMVARRAGSLWAFNQIATVSQWLFAAAVGLALSHFIWPELSHGFGLVMSAGFMGGHGTSVVVGDIFAGLGWEDALTLSLSFATAGIFISIIVGMIILQVALKKGWVTEFTQFEQMTRTEQRGLIAPPEQKPIMNNTMSSLSVDSFAIHGALILAVTASAYHLATYLSSFHDKVQLPTFVVGFLLGMIARVVAKRSGAQAYLCDNVFSHAGGVTTDFLIVFGVSAIKITVLLNYLAPMAILLVCGVCFTLFLVFWVAPRMLGKQWFEKAIFSWGWLTGTVAMGIALLRIIDPKMRGKVLDDFAIAYVPGSIVDIIVISLMPIAMVSGLYLEAFGIGLGYMALVLLLWRTVLSKQ